MPSLGGRSRAAWVPWQYEGPGDLGHLPHMLASLSKEDDRVWPTPVLATVAQVGLGSSLGHSCHLWDLAREQPFPEQELCLGPLDNLELV